MLFKLSENYLINLSNVNIKIWSQRVNGSNDLWLYGYLKDNVGEFSIKLDLTEIGTLWLSEEEVNDYRLLMQAFNKHNNKKYDLYTRLYIDNVEIEIADASQLYKLVFLCETRLKMITEFDGNLTLILKKVNLGNVHEYIQQAIFLFNLLNDHKMTFGFSTPNEYKLTGYDNINFLEFKTSKAKYLKAIFLFNNAETQSEETSFLHYYRILEHFYYVNYNEVICEENLLKKLFSNPQLKYRIEEMLYKSGLNISTKKLAEKIYSYRNSVVHSKEEKLFVVDLLKKPIELESDYLLSRLIKDIALCCIKLFCYDDNLGIIDRRLYY